MLIYDKLGKAGRAPSCEPSYVLLIRHALRATFSKGEGEIGENCYLTSIFVSLSINVFFYF